MFFFVFFLAPFSAASLSQLRGAPGTRVLQAVFSEASFLTCTLFLRRAASSRAHDGYRRGRRRRRRRRARKGSEGKVSSGQVGTVVKGRLLNGPVWDNRRACEGTSN